MAKFTVEISQLKAQLAAAEKDKALKNGARAYSVHCAEKKKKLDYAYSRGELKTWDDLGIDDIPQVIRAQPFDRMAMLNFIIPWCAAAEQRYLYNETQRKTEVQQVSTRFVKAETNLGITKVGRFTLRPRQKKCLDLGIERLRSKVTSALMVPLEGGEGKSVIAGGYLKYWIDNNYFDHPSPKIIPMHNAVFTTAAAVKLDMEERMRSCDLPYRGVTITSHTEWHTKAWDPLFKTIQVEAHGTKVNREVYIMPAPSIVVIDESDAYKKPASLKSQRMLAIVEAGLKVGSVFIFMSATPGSKINDMWLFAIATGRKWQGESLTMETFPSMARAIAARAGTTPDQDSPRAMEEFRKEFNDCYIVPPRDPRKVKAYNKVKLLEFKTQKDRDYYQRTIERYQEELERCGQVGAQVNPLTAFLKLRQSEEWLKTTYFVDEMLSAHSQGFAPVCGVSFTASCNEIVRQLVARGVARDNISVIQGGDEIITKDKLIKMVGQDLFDNIGNYIMRFYEPDVYGPLTPKERSAVKKYIKWTKERVRNEESEADQSLRIDQLKALRLYKQSKLERHTEKERFQQGKTQFMVFTLSSGGRGIDMDHQFEHVRPRRGFFTICYWAEEFMQALYRLMRVATISDVEQNMCFFAGTKVANHVAPILDRKIKSVRAGVSADNFADEAINLLAQPAKPDIKQTDLRDGADTDTEEGEGFDADSAIDQLNLELVEEE